MANISKYIGHSECNMVIVRFEKGSQNAYLDYDIQHTNHFYLYLPVSLESTVAQW